VQYTLHLTLSKEGEDEAEYGVDIDTEGDIKGINLMLRDAATKFVESVTANKERTPIKDVLYFN